MRVVKLDDSVEVRTVTVNVIPNAEVPQITQFAVTPAFISAGECVDITWQVQGQVSNVKLTRDGGIIWDGAPMSGTFNDCPPNTGIVNYGIDATGPGGTSQQQQAVTVSEPAPANPLANTNWQLASISGQPLVDGTTITAFFSAQDTVSGFGGCNDYNGGYTVNGNNLTVGPLTATGIACDDSINQQEAAYFTSLESAATFEISGSQLIIKNGSGQEVLRYNRIG